MGIQPQTGLSMRLADWHRGLNEGHSKARFDAQRFFRRFLETEID